MMSECSIEGCAVPVRARGWCSKHYQRWMDHGSTDTPPPPKPRLPRPILTRLMERVDPRRKITTPLRDPWCWEWQGKLGSGGGKYGALGGVGGRGKIKSAHAVAYELFIGPVPEDLELDHLCKNTACCNPRHAEPVTRAENVRRSRNANREKTHCIHGHPLVEGNIYRYKVRGRERRVCRRCHLDGQNRRRASK
jgi:HNH endonuclease